MGKDDFETFNEQLRAMLINERDDVMRMAAQLVLDSQTDPQLVLQAQQIVGGR